MDERQRAAEARHILTNPLWEEAFEAIRGGIVLQLEQAAIRDREWQHELTLMLQMVKQVRTQFERYMQTGQLEQPDIIDSFVAKVRALTK